MAIRTIDGFSGERRLEHIDAPRPVVRAFRQLERDEDIVHFRDRGLSNTPVEPVIAVLGVLEDGQPMRQTVAFSVAHGQEKSALETTEGILESIANHRAVRLNRFLSSASSRAIGGSGDDNFLMSLPKHVYGSPIKTHTYGGVLIGKRDGDDRPSIDIFCNTRVGDSVLDAMDELSPRSTAESLRMLRSVLDSGWNRKRQKRLGLRSVSPAESIAMSVVLTALPVAKELRADPYYC